MSMMMMTHGDDDAAAAAAAVEHRAPAHLYYLLQQQHSADSRQHSPPTSLFINQPNDNFLHTQQTRKTPPITYRFAAQMIANCMCIRDLDAEISGYYIKYAKLYRLALTRTGCRPA